MRVLRGRNVCELLPLGADLLAHEGERADSRAGPVMVTPWPVMSVYERPAERVLLSPVRDANPFFHLFESLWMLSGRNDTASLDHFIHDFGARFGEADGTMHGAYGHRWRHALGFDQLGVIMGRLRADPNDRQCVLQMWDASSRPDWDQNHGNAGPDDLNGVWKDRPCNTHVYFRVRDNAYRDPVVTDQNSAEHEARITRGENLVLDMTVCCRSNDIVHGAYGANAVHFSVLMEYVAGGIGVGMGTMHQFSNNYHGYVSVLDKLGDPRLLLEEADPYELTGYAPQPMGEDWSRWDEDLVIFMSEHDRLWTLEPTSMELDLADGLYNSWFYGVAWNVVLANWLHRHDRRDEALTVAGLIEAGDWRRACVEWLGRRYAR